MRPPVASPAGRTGPSRAGAPLILPGATLAEALGNSRPDPRSIPPYLRALLPLLAAGHRRYQIAALLGVPRACAESRIARLYRLLGVHNRRQAVAVARQIGLLPKTPKGT